MTWAKVCDTLHSHPKVCDAGLEAMGLWVKALSYCAAYATNGHVKRSAAANLAGTQGRADRLAAKLVSAGLWEPHPCGDGWQVHDYLEHNPSRAEVEANRERWVTRARAGGLAKAAKARASGLLASRRQAGSQHVESPAPDPDPKDLIPPARPLQDCKGDSRPQLTPSTTPTEFERRRAEQLREAEAFKERETTR